MFAIWKTCHTRKHSFPASAQDAAYADEGAHLICQPPLVQHGILHKTIWQYIGLIYFVKYYSGAWKKSTHVTNLSDIIRNLWQGVFHMGSDHVNLVLIHHTFKVSNSSVPNKNVSYITNIFRYLHKINIIKFTVISEIKRVKFHVLAESRLDEAPG